MSYPFLESLSQWVRTEYPALKEFGKAINIPDVMVSPHIVPLPSATISKITEGCRAIFDETHSTPSSTPSVFTSFDFYITPQGPRLIEINTNAAGAILSDLIRQFHGLGEPGYFETIRHMFESIAQSASITQIQTIAIVDETPDLQKTKFEFQLFQALFQSWGWHCAICDPIDLQWIGNKLIAPDGSPIDIVYNRYCDFYMTSDRATALRVAIQNGVPVTPNPEEYGRMADKFNLIKLAHSNHPIIRELVPPVIHVNQSNPEDLWAQRKKLFFKPAQSFGSKAAYKGERISKKVFQTLWDTDTIAQPYFDAGTILADEMSFKYDIRAYTYEGNVQLIGARLFQGQLMNFQTLGGGFAAVSGQ